MNERPLVVDLFAGAGGLSLGFEQAGFDVAAAVEVDPIHAAVHKFNFPACAVLARSVVGLSGQDIRAAAGIGDREVTAVIGGAPCQGFSLIGQRALDDPRNSLVREFVRIVRELQPRFFLFENVKGLTLGPHRQFLEELLDEFATAKYTVRLPWRVLNAADFDVPQHRERLFLIGSRTDCELPEYPMETTYAANKNAVLGRVQGPTTRDALDDLPNADMFDELLEFGEVRTTAFSEPSTYARVLRSAAASDWFFAHRRAWSSSLLTNSVRTAHSEISQLRFRDTVPGSVEPISRFLRLDPNGVSNTLRAGSDAARGAFTSPRPIHYRYNRCITVREMARLHGFPDWFRFHSTKWHGAREIGNAVAPPVARRLAEQMAAAMGYMPTRATAIVSLGDEELLRQDLGSAAAFWGVPLVSGKRDTRSPFRKRSQAETEVARLASGERRVGNGR